ncbi:MAG: MurR/RpiR family transcriptional regulator [Anaerovibrio sp.]
MSRLVRVLKEQKDFSEAERIIAAYLLENYQDIANMSTRQLANNAYTSPSAIVRFCQKLGFEGYTDFRVRFLADMLQVMGQPGETEEFSANDTVRRAIEKATNMEFNALRETRAMLQPAVVVKAVEMIRAAEHVDFYATDENENIARQAASNLAWLDKTYTIPITMTQMYLMSSNGQRKHLSIIISRTGENRMLVDVANNLRERNGKILLITGEKDSSLAKLADCVLMSGSAERVEVLGYRIWWVCAEYVVDMLMAAMIAQNGLKNICKRSKWLKDNFVL